MYQSCWLRYFNQDIIILVFPCISLFAVASLTMNDKFVFNLFNNSCSIEHKSMNMKIPQFYFIFIFHQYAEYKIKVKNHQYIHVAKRLKRRLRLNVIVIAQSNVSSKPTVQVQYINKGYNKRVHTHTHTHSSHLINWHNFSTAQSWETVKLRIKLDSTLVSNEAPWRILLMFWILATLTKSSQCTRPLQVASNQDWGDGG